nr:hypothetical protein [Solirubrobacterales bacterium]
MGNWGNPDAARSLPLCATMLALCLLLPALAHAGTASEQITALNAQREAHGIPAGIVERPDWSEGCRRHMEYIAANGGTLTHEEQPDRPGYTVNGAMIGPRSVLSPEVEAFGAAGNAFETAPLHLMQVLAPALTQMGVWGGCATTSLGYSRKPAKAELFSYPGDGVGGVRESEIAAEAPFVPGDLVGLPMGTTTGPHVYVMSFGTGPGYLQSATIDGPGGPLELRVVDNETPRLEGLMPPGGILIPVAPLAASATYNAAVTFQPREGGQPLTRRWSFSTGGAAPSP